MNRRNQRWFFAVPLLAFAILGNTTVFAQYTLSTLVTSPGAFGDLQNVNGLAVDNAGNIYATGVYPGGAHSALFQISSGGGTPRITAIAGANTSLDNLPGCSGNYGATSVLIAPRSLAVDNAGNVYIASQDAPAVVRVSGGTLTPISSGAWNGTPNFVCNSSASAAAVDNAGNVYFSESAYGAYVYKVTPAGVVSTVAGNGTTGCMGGEIGIPQEMAVDVSGNLYLADSLCEAIWKVTPSGTITLVAGNLSRIPGCQNGAAIGQTLYGPTGVAVDTYGDVFVADSCGVRMVTPNNQITTINATIFPHSIAVGTGGNIFAGYNGNIYQLTPMRPSPTSVSPGSGSAFSQVFTFTFTDPNGYSDLSVLDVLINNYLDGVGACYFAWVPSGASAGYVYLVDDAGDGGYAGGSPMFVPTSNSLSNSQCTISGTGSSVSSNGNTLTLTLAITFTSGFAGNKIFYMAARSNTQNSGWQALGTWNVPGAAPVGPAVGGVNPGRSTSMGQTYTFTFTDSNGYTDLNVLDILTNSFLDGISACYVAYVPTGATTGYLYLVDDAGDGGYAAGSPLLLSSGGTLQNSQCTINTTGSSASASGNTLNLNLNIAFNAGFAGNQVFYLAARNSGSGNSGWQAVGSVTVP